MAVKELLKEAVAIMNLPLLDDDNRNKLKDILCYLSEWKANNNSEAGNYPQLDFVLYNASRKLRTFGYNRLNKFENEIINNGDELSILRDETIDKYYKTESGFVLDKLQKAVLDEFEDSHQKLFLSAPTSFGKTFLLKEIIFRHHKEYSNIIIVLPTVALLMEVTGEIEEFNNKHFLNYNLYNSIYRDLELSDRNIFILTPERVLRLFAIIPDINIDFFFFDEIYKIDEDVSIKSEDDVNEKIDYVLMLLNKHVQRIYSGLSKQQREIFLRECSMYERYLFNAIIRDAAWKSEKVVRYEREIKSYRKQLKSIKKSHSYRLGRTLTMPYRLIKGGIKCCRQHGFTYTCKLTAKKIIRKLK